MKRAHWSMSTASAQALEPSGEAAFVEFIRRTRLGVALSIGFLVGTMAAVVWSANSQNSKFSGSDAILMDIGMFSAVTLAILLVRAPGSLLRSILFGGKSLSEIVRMSVVGLLGILAFLIVPKLIFRIPVLHWITIKSIFDMHLRFTTGLWMMFLAPLSEELIFRCWLQTRLTSVIGKFSVPITFLIFSAFHGGGFAFIMVLPLAIVLSVIRYKSKALLPGILVHAMYNMIIYVSLFFVIGQKA